MRLLFKYRFLAVVRGSAERKGGFPGNKEEHGRQVQRRPIQQVQLLAAENQNACARDDQLGDSVKFCWAGFRIIFVLSWLIRFLKIEILQHQILLF